MNTLEESFRLLAVSVAMGHGFGFSPSSFQILSDIIRQGVAELETKPQIASQDIVEAQKALFDFVTAMAEEARLTNRPEMSEDITAKIKRRLCPLYPWIKKPCPPRN